MNRTINISALRQTPSQQSFACTLYSAGCTMTTPCTSFTSAEPRKVCGSFVADSRLQAKILD